MEISSYAFIDCNDLVIYVDEVSKPSSWGNYWNGSAVTVFDYKNKELFKEDIYLFELIDGEVSIIKCFSNESKIVIPNNIVYNDISYPVTIIDDSAFSKKAQLSEITFPNTLKTIGKYSFEDCTNLSEITLPNSLKTIKDYAFENCSSLSVVIIPLSVETMGFAIFPKYAQNLVIKVEAKEDAEGWTPSWNNGCAIIYDYLNNIQFAHNNITYILKDEYLSVIYVSSTSVVIPSFVTYEGVDYPVKRINENAFTYTLITDVVINEGVEVIERGAFFNCTALTSIVLPNSLKEIGDSAFSSCSSLREIVIPKNVTTIEKNAFYYCYSLVIFVEKNSTEVNYDSLWNGDSIVIYDCQNQIYLKTDSFLYHIVDNEATLIAYYKNESSNVVIPNTITINDTNYDVTRISDNVFYNNEMKSIVLPNSLKEIGINTFSLCSSLREINLPDGLIHIGSNAFSGLAITTIRLPESLYKIDSSAFSSCKNLEEIVIPENIETISEYTFYNCISLSSVTLNNGLVEIQKYAFVNTAIEELILPSSLKTIGYSAFSDCSSLQEVTFNDGIEYIEEYAFQNTSVETVKLPSTIIKLYLSAFMKTNVDVIYLNAKEDTALVVSASTGASQPTIYEYLNKEIIETDNYIYSVEDNQATLVLCKKDKEEIALENTINSIPVTIIGTYAFNDCTTLRDIILPNQLLEIKNAAFYDTNIGNVVLPSTLEKIYYNSFENTNYMVFYTELESKKSEWIISDTNTIIYDYLNKEIIEENNLVYVIEDEKAILYGLNTLLTTIVIPEYVSNYPVYRIERYAFYSTQINELVLPNTLEEIAYRSFENCTLESVFMPSEVKTIDLEAFCTRNKIVIYTSLSYRPSGWHENLSYDYIIFYNQNQ